MTKGNEMTLHGVTVDSILSNSMVAFLPYCLYLGKDDGALCQTAELGAARRHPPPPARLRHA